MNARSRRAATPVGLLRLALAAAIIIAIAATHLDTASRTTVVLVNMYGYFTVQSNLIGAAALIVSAALTLTRREPSTLSTLLRALATTCLVIVGLVYAVLLAPLGAAGGVPLPWANVVMHVVSPIAIAIDWLLVGDRRRVAVSRFWVPLIYPVAWTIVVLIRGATDGWVPYPFLNPAQGYDVVALYAVAIAVLFGVASALALWVTRLPGLLLRRP
ncbi:hypothetical protein GCM10011490_13930 [Pseudoclavibacter endophyticus]|uniref:Pr6Pr family membrane protein n=1 Tax=Pseudoclavibacter endophyticus TaxID=1778590 RepID=A0A6H9WE88_9MICO|nr:Pr6Pr family membrane protein [Pseudoclavibacter endophyticus]KAB1649209.1 hypothetical protein F8O04_02715 [Pseudoclavibacter endophyticus]GGA64495.1 hypothetical protein GCM10011490_13930 [Pseudoclavibacter endophyticus]